MSKEQGDGTRVDLEVDLNALAAQLREGVQIEDRKYRFKTYRQCFVGSEACDWLVSSGEANDYAQAVLLGNLLLEEGVLHHVVKEHGFKNEHLFYRFASDEDHGKKRRRGDGATVSWTDFVKSGWDLEEEGESFQARLDEDEASTWDAAASCGIEPLDEYNTALLDHVHPRAWVNPTPKPRYNMVVIGAGAGGLVTAVGAAGVGARVALIESHLLGGDCLNVGCVPSKALLRCAKVAASARRASEYGVKVTGVEVDFPAVMERMRRLRAKIAPNDSAERFAGLGVDVFIGHGRFTGPNQVEVNGETLTFAKGCIASGGSPAVPPIPGLAEAPYLTNVNLFNLTALPPRLGVLGGGVIGVEMAQAFQRLGAQVTLFERGTGILSREDPDAAAVVQEALTRDGVRFEFGADLERVSHTPAKGEGDWPEITLHLGGGETQTFDALLVAAGRRANVEGMGLDVAGVEYSAKGVEVNDRMQTSNPDIYAVGDVASRYAFTHAADFTARMVIKNALFRGRDRFSRLLIPWSVYSEPELAHVGLYERDLEERGVAFRTFTREFSDVDRSILEGEEEGFVRVHVKQGSDEILGATVVGAHAGELISELTLAMQGEIGLGKLASVIHPYPTASEAIRQLGDQYNRTRLTPTVKKLFRRLMDFQR